MLAHFVKSQGIDIDVAVNGFQESACRTDFFHDEVAAQVDDFDVVGGYHLVDGRGTEGDRNKVKGCHEGEG